MNVIDVMAYNGRDESFDWLYKVNSPNGIFIPDH